MVLGDDARLRQVIGNLMTNALTHTPPDAAVTLRLRAEAGDRAVIEVADTGPGLPPEQAERVFERFYRADKPRGPGATDGPTASGPARAWPSWRRWCGARRHRRGGQRARARARLPGAAAACTAPTRIREQIASGVDDARRDRFTGKLQASSRSDRSAVEEG